MGQRSKNRIQEKDIEDNEDMKKGGIAIRIEIYLQKSEDLQPEDLNFRYRRRISIYYSLRSELILV